ncbi:3-hydroxy-3-methylglutaryl-coenzyme A reductase [Roseinatronobacter bogoriensis subsp. barguzinensis]|uniref:hydroxymethylglutaryl-CoA reductase (NADPH) n=2 Tax=Roseinatronobacter bogoriensis TaxID=119542 RepID=A0A2K8KBY3_9RHOB|nr:3-hydroxy-3-methylglutaryl-CoA reductase [Rhodobaca barguzinensis]TDW41193.1 3-hydroxy-3-methylglutaryl-coenzyme A reductase [Rhodobaca barguzinensis]TDY74629.1 3-hydroxy-3-methylglutaryl-coenzyme A reductase [Rhodobaca bogoriensis DSM 18756]
MTIPSHVKDMLNRIRARFFDTPLHERMLPSDAEFTTLRPVRKATRATVAKYWARLATTTDASDRDAIADPLTLAMPEQFNANIENFIGTVKLPVGIIGPLRINGLNAHGDFHVPMATTEAALVASYARGAYAATKSGGVSTAILYEGVIRTPAFVLENLLNAGLFVEWVVSQVDQLKAAAESTTRHGKLISVEPVIDNNVVFLICRYTTGDAAGQNMVTIATNALCDDIVARCPVALKAWYIEGNFSGDKKASFLGLVTGRGRKVSASVTLKAGVVERSLGTSVQAMLDYGQVANLGAHLSGQLGAQAHYANGLAALYLATGQDAACVAESAIGITRMEARGQDLFCSVTMPNILVGSVGGGTSLPSQSAGLNILGLKGAGHGAALAEVVAATCLCGEISIVAAIAAGHFTRAHENLARHR